MKLIQGKKELPGVSPISLMIQGQNQDLAERQYYKNFNYLRSQQFEMGTNLHFPELNLQNIQEFPPPKALSPK